MKISYLLSAFIAGCATASAADPIPATPFSSFEAYEGKGVENICDGDLGTIFYSKAPSYAWAGLDLGEQHVITSIKYAPNAVVASLLGMFQGANNADFSDAVPLAFITEKPKKGEMNELVVTCSRGVRYVRYVGPAEWHSQIAELQVYGNPGAGDDFRLWQLTNLPTVVINTVNSEEPYDKEHDITATIVIISEEGTEVLDKPGSIRERGNSSRWFPKKPWRIKFDKKQNVLDAPSKAKKWTLINNYGDKSLMRNLLAFETAEVMGMDYVPFCRPVDVVLNGEYKGCYQLCDQIEVNSGRVDIDEMEPTDNAGDALTGGYLLEIDAYANQEISWFTTDHYGLTVTIKSPDDDKITPQQKAYIKNVFDTVEQEMRSRDGYDCTDPETGYRRIFDTKSFIRHMLVNEVAGNTDTYWSTYMFKRRNDPKLYTGPVWDFDLGFDNDSRVYPVTSKSRNGYLWDSGYASSSNGMRFFAQRILLKDPTTAEEILAVWKKARENGFSAKWLKERADYWAEELDESQKLNFMRWPILSEYVHQNPRVGHTYEQEVKWIKEYIDSQIEHLDAVIGYEDSGVEELPESEFEVNASVNSALVDLLGRRVENPGPGIYVRSDGRKILVK